MLIVYFEVSSAIINRFEIDHCRTGARIRPTASVFATGQFVRGIQVR